MDTTDDGRESGFNRHVSAKTKVDETKVNARHQTLINHPIYYHHSPKAESF